MDDKGEMIDSVASQSGIMQVGERSFEEVMQASIGSWLSRYLDASIN